MTSLRRRQLLVVCAAPLSQAVAAQARGGQPLAVTVSARSPSVSPAKPRAQAAPRPADQPSSNPSAQTSPAAPTAPLLQRLLRITGLDLAPGQLRSPDVAAGSVWVADINGREPPVRWSTDYRFRSPVFDAGGRSLYVLQDEQLFHLEGPGRPPMPLQRLPGVHKLVGVLDGELVLLRNDERQPLAAMPLDAPPLATALAIPRPLVVDVDNAAARGLLGRMQGDARGTEQFVIFLQRQSGESLVGRVEWNDIVLQPRNGSPPRNLTRSGGLDCAQPALDARAERIAYVVVDG